MNKRLRKLLAYIYVPIIFASVSYSILAIALSPFYDIVSSVVGIMVLNERMNFELELTSSYEATDIHEGIIKLEDLTLPVYGEHYGQLTIDRINVNTPVYFGDDYSILRAGVGHYAGSFFPGLARTTLLAGHNTTVFRPLRYAEVGDTVIFNTYYGVFEYKIYEIRIVHQSEYNTYLNLYQDEKDILLMYTCYPFDGLIGVAKERLFVYAEKVSGPTILEGGQ